tara:strand:- start:1527 stop:1688 length:162 start_codon:yes stop_codon:yes gene_type:complete
MIVNYSRALNKSKAKRRLKKIELNLNLKDPKLGLTAREYNERVKLIAFIKESK